MPEEKELVFDVYFPGEPGAGLNSFSDVITIKCESGDFGGDPGEFEEFIIDALKEWYDGAGVEIRERAG